MADETVEIVEEETEELLQAMPSNEVTDADDIPDQTTESLAGDEEDSEDEDADDEEAVG